MVWSSISSVTPGVNHSVPTAFMNATGYGMGHAWRWIQWVRNGPRLAMNTVGTEWVTTGLKNLHVPRMGHLIQ